MYNNTCIELANYNYVNQTDCESKYNNIIMDGLITYSVRYF